LATAAEHRERAERTLCNHLRAGVRRCVEQDFRHIGLERIEYDARMHAVLFTIGEGNGPDDRHIQTGIPCQAMDDRIVHAVRYSDATAFFQYCHTIIAGMVLDEIAKHRIRSFDQQAHDRRLELLQAPETAHPEHIRNLERELEEQRARMMLALTQAQAQYGIDLGRFANPNRISQEAEHKADRTLREFLTVAQRETWDHHRFIVIHGGASNSPYILVGRSHTNIYRSELSHMTFFRGRARMFRKLCFIPRQQLPLGDVILLQKLALETNETETLALANNFGTATEYAITLKKQWGLRERHLTA